MASASRRKAEPVFKLNEKNAGEGIPKLERASQNAPGKQVAFIPSLEPYAPACSPPNTTSNSIAKEEPQPYSSVPSTQPVKYDYRMIADAQRRHQRTIERIENALRQWQPTIHAGNNSGTAIESPISDDDPQSDAKAQPPTKDSAIEPSINAQDEDSYVPDSYQQAAIFAAEAGESFFLTGSAGTGKSFVLKKVIKLLRAKRLEVAVTASTGCAAVAIQGNTVHSATGIGLGMDPPQVLRHRARTNRNMRERLNAIDVLVLDEVSMIDSFLFDKLELIFSTARATRVRQGKRSRADWFRKKRSVGEEEEPAPFGGVQVIVCGDFFQLPPVAASDYKLQYSNEKYFAFECEAWKRAIKKTIILRVVHRQSNRNFVGLLNEIRHGVVSETSREVLDACHIENSHTVEIKPNGDPLHFTKLFSHRKNVDLENYSRLHKIKDYPGVQYHARDTINEEEIKRPLTKGAVLTLLNNVPGPDVTELKERSRVLCLKNIDKERGIVNGSAGYLVGFQEPHEALQISVEEWQRMTTKQRYERYGEVADAAKGQKVSLREGKLQEKFKNAARDATNGFIKIDGEAPAILPVVRFDNGVEMAMLPERWDIYGTTGEIVAWRSQIPLTLGWALSIHKSQGMSLQYVQTELARAFDFGQVYVAISRATSAQGLRLTSFDRNKVMTHDKVITFYARAEQNDAKVDSQERKKLKLESEIDPPR